MNITEIIEQPFSKCYQNFDDFEEILYETNLNLFKEGLIKTYPFDFAKSRLANFGYLTYDDKKKNIIFKPRDTSQVIFLNKFLDSMGYYIAEYIVLYNGIERKDNNFEHYKKYDEFSSKISDVNELWLVIEPNRDNLIPPTEEIKYIYHLTEKKYLDKIYKNGIVPRSSSKRSFHPDRIYIVIIIDALKMLLVQFSRNKDINDYVVLKIDYNLAGKPELHNDPNFYRLGYFTLDNIRPSAIIEEIDPNKIM